MAALTAGEREGSTGRRKRSGCGERGKMGAQGRAGGCDGPTRRDGRAEERKGSMGDASEMASERGTMEAQGATKPGVDGASGRQEATNI
ncbi:hypothetical protein FGB62_31g136 [Gracilaria domingensis]|nr:hypothetical protein FGB62_31g136 [Gracilaria domingensis]